jgi:hypothetical protein
VVRLQTWTDWIRNQVFLPPGPDPLPVPDELLPKPDYPSPFLTIEELLRLWAVDPLGFLFLVGAPACLICAAAFLYRSWHRQGGNF